MMSRWRLRRPRERSPTSLSKRRTTLRRISLRIPSSRSVRRPLASRSKARTLWVLTTSKKTPMTPKSRTSTTSRKRTSLLSRTSKRMTSRQPEITFLSARTVTFSDTARKKTSAMMKMNKWTGMLAPSASYRRRWACTTNRPISARCRVKALLELSNS